MGTIYDRQLRSRKVHPDGMPVKVGTAPPRCATTATVIEQKNGVWSYCDENDELDIEVWLLKHQEVVLGGLDAEEVLLWTGMEVKLASTAATRKWMHKELVVALTNPASQNWWWSGKFKPVRKRGAEQKLATLARELQSAREMPPLDQGFVRPIRGESALPEALRTLPFDPFETDDKWLTARMPDPMRFHWKDVRAVAGEYSVAHNPAHRTGPKPRHPERDDRKVDQPLWSFGICANFNQAFKEIKQAALHHPRYGQTRDPGGPEYAIQQAEFEILDAAVWQAMAGRVKAGQDIVDRVIEIFRPAYGKRIAPRPR